MPWPSVRRDYVRGLLSRLFSRRDFWGRGRKRQGHPGVPAGRPVVGGEFPKGFEAEVGLDGLAREDERDLRADRGDARQIGSEEPGRALIPRELRVDIAHG